MIYMKALKKIIKSIVRHLIANKLIIYIIYEELKKIRTKDYSKIAIFEKNASIDESGEILNLSNNKNSVVIGENAIIRGSLLVFKYGGSINIGQWCYVGDHTRIWSGEKIIIGNYVLISHEVFITDTSAHEFEYEIRAERYKELVLMGPPDNKLTIKTAPIIIEDYAWINPKCIILPGVRIGKGAIIGAGSVVTKDVPPFTLYAGNPARFIKELPK